MKKYNPKVIESRWQKYWQENNTFVADSASQKEKKYILTEFPYPSGEGLHMGHVRGYTAGDVTSRFYRLCGYEVMFPMGWDAFGLPAENYAIKTGVHPSITTKQNIKNFRKQMDALGFSFDWSREVNTTDPEFYKWTQWLFLQFFKAGLAFEATGLINWCPKDKTGLANEEVVNGACERCGTVVEKKELRQWYLRITDYAQKLLDGLQNLPDWPSRVKLQQENWIGKSEGAEIDFAIKDSANKVKVFTTRPDTIFGATFLVVSPELLNVWVAAGVNVSSEVISYIEASLAKSEQDRVAEKKDKSGVDSGFVALNPATKEEIPIWVADYVLGNYGTGAIMAVPAHDERDFAFAKKYNLPITQVISSNLESSELSQAFIEEGTLINSGAYTGRKSSDVILAMANEFGTPKVQYKLRDWVFSRQRYWGEPIPLIHCDKCGVVAVPESDLPVLLPDVKNYEPTGTGESPLAGIEEWVNVKCPNCDGQAKRETNTMPQWAGSSWYYLRYADPQNKTSFADQEKLKHWLPVDMYFGGMEHTTLHLLYSRFWHEFLFDQGLVPSPEPYTKRIPHGIILAADGEKMSKSLGNVVNPDELVKEYGADTLRMFELFLGPHEAQVSWNSQGIVGVRRFLDRFYSWAQENIANPAETDLPEFLKLLNSLNKKITDDLSQIKFNTAVSAFMEFLNNAKDFKITTESLKVVAVLLAPLAPHIAEEVYELAGGKGLQTATWPRVDEQYLTIEKVEVVVQVNGKIRDKLIVDAGLSEEELKSLALSSEKIKTSLTGEPKKIIVVKDKLVSIVM